MRKAVSTRFTATRSRPQTLQYRDVVALAGDAYRTFIETEEDKVGPDHFDMSRDEFDADVRSFMVDDLAVGSSPPAMARKDAELLASLMLPNGGPLLAWLSGGINTPIFKMHESEALEQLVGRQADAIVAKRGVRLDPPSRTMLLKELGRTLLLGTARLKQITDGNFRRSAPREVS